MSKKTAITKKKSFNDKDNEKEEEKKITLNGAIKSMIFILILLNWL